jgi:antitoxin (DNA-binding transcriptional repressor) of toxin-antitoxin stability system
MPKTVSIAYFRANLPKLLKDVKKGQSVLISRYKEPVALISPVPKAESEKPGPRFGTGKGRVRLIDPHAFDPMTDEEVDAFVEGRY